MKKFINKYEKMMKKKLIYHLDDEENYIRTIFEKQARLYARYIKEEEEYIPYRLKK